MFGLEKIFNKPISKNKFAELVLEQLKSDLPEVTFTYDEPNFLFKSSNGSTLFLNNFHEDYVKIDKPARALLMSRLVKVAEVPPVPLNFDDAREKLLPVMRFLPGLELTLLEAEGKGLAESDAWRMQEFSSVLGVGVAYDTEAVVHQIGKTGFSDWGISMEDAMAIALDNLRHKAAPSYVQVIPGTYVFQYGDQYDATRILLPEVAWQLELSGNPVAMIPTRDVLLITGDKDEAGQNVVIALAKDRLNETSRHLSPEMFRLDGTTWTSWQPEGANGDELRSLALGHRAGDYNAQKEALAKLYAGQGKDDFVASFTAMQSPEGRAFSYSTLSFRLQTLLPESELVVLFDPDGSAADTNYKPFIVKWETLQEELGSNLVRLPYVMPRHSVYFDPTAEQLARLQLHEVSLS